MHTLQNIISQIGYGFVCSFWQMGLLFALYKIGTSVYITAPSERFRFAFSLSITGSAWFLVTILWGGPSFNWPLQGGLTQHIPTVFSDLYAKTMTWLGYGYIGFLAIASTKSYLQLKFARKWMASGQVKAPLDWRLFVEKQAALLGIKKKVILKISDGFSPATFGFLTPVILLPASCLTGLEPKQLQAILMHELAHIRRCDYLAARVMHFAEILLYFNPFMRQLVREAKKECEQACDDLVMQFEYHPLDYARALLSVAKTGQNVAWVLPAQGAHQQVLLNRIHRLLGQYPGNRLFSFKGLAMAGLALGVFFATGAYKAFRKPALPMTFTADFASAPLPEPSQVIRSNQFHEARLALIAAAANQKADRQQARAAEKEALIASQEKLKALADEEREMAAILSQETNVLAVANIIQEQEAESGIRKLEKAWKQFNRLLEKLDLQGDLQANEWQQIAILISLHADIRASVINDENNINLSTITPAVGTIHVPETQILVIVHDEATGKLAASFMYPHEITEELDPVLNPGYLPENLQPVILLKKKANGKKIIRL